MARRGAPLMWADQTVASVFLVSLGATVVAVWIAARMLTAMGFSVANYRGVAVLRPSGVVFPVVLSATGLVIMGLPHAAAGAVDVFFVAGWAFALLGFVDDVFGDRSVGGLAGHLRALRRGRITTGLIKATGGIVVGLWAGWRLGLGVWGVVIAAAVIALTANFINLLDVRPGRAIKTGLVLIAAALVFSRGPVGWLVWPALLPPIVALLALDLREIAMLGDTGANFLGAMIGLTFVINSSWQAQLAAAILLAAATLASEKHSFSAVIERVAPLRWLDLLGRRSAMETRGDKGTD